MKILAFIVIATGALISPLTAQTKDPLWDEDRISNTTVLLFQKLSNGSADIGSGTIITRNGRHYVLTASQVSKKMKNDAKIIFRLKGDKPGIFDLLPLTNGKSLKWQQHPIADITIIDLDSQDNSIKTILVD